MKPASLDPLTQITWLATYGSELLAARDQAYPNASDDPREKRSEQSSEENLLPWQKSMLDAQRSLRTRSAKRFPDPERWLWTERSLAQASDWWTASIKATVFPDAANVVDACCGAGADTVALAQHHQVVALDRDESLLPIVAANLASHGLAGMCQQSDFANGKFTSQQWLHVDPDRRPTKSHIHASERILRQGKTLVGEQFSPPLEEVLEASSRVAGSLIKLAPTTEMTERSEDQINANATRVWIGNMGECRQQWAVLGAARERCSELFGCEPDARIAVLGEPWGGVAFDFAKHVQSFAAKSPIHHRVIPTAKVEAGNYVFDLHSVLHASELQTAWAAKYELRALTDGGGYYVGADPVHTSWAHTFEVLDVVAWDDRKVRKTLRNLGAGRVEVKNRLLRLDANAYQRRYSTPDGQPITLLVTKMGDRVRAIVARRIPRRGALGGESSL